MKLLPYAPIKPGSVEDKLFKFGIGAGAMTMLLTLVGTVMAILAGLVGFDPTSLAEALINAITAGIVIGLSMGVIGIVIHYARHFAVEPWRARKS